VDNPARVAPSQRKYISFPSGQRFQPIRPAPSGEPNWKGWEKGIRKGPGVAHTHIMLLKPYTNTCAGCVIGLPHSMSLMLASCWPSGCVCSASLVSCTAGFVLLKDTQPEAGEVDYLFEEEKPAAASAAAAPAAAGGATAAPAAGGAAAASPAGDEPPPPEPFEYIPS
jgi:hypothetical protein